ncbi:hypothetical protein L210DRAFT_3619381 [Boletus edulis BED1]|uniref:Uncharacterized protein n=1 Tax=Boletus edulis BED1 TaxID=1328754 RepID=A0AAD4C5A6_BOLED|nr:hypothetical protein L210DRAFT_3619381 [Boletus edulis BED1]
MAVEPLMGTRAQRAFIITIGVQAVIVITMVACTFGIVHAYLGNIFDSGSYKTLSCYLALFILAEGFELFMAYDALRMRNIIQLLGIILFHGALIVFSALQVHETRVALVNNGWLLHKVEPFLIVAPCIVAASWLFLIFWLKQLYGEFGWVIFHVVGASPKLKSMYQFYQIFICLLKFDFFCFVGVTMQLLIVVLSANSAEFGLTITAIPVVLTLIAGCGYAVRREIKWMMSIALALMLPCMGYFYKLARFYLPLSQSEYITTRATLTVFTIVAFLLLLTTFLVGLKCFYDFDKGLLDSKTHGQFYKPVRQQALGAFKIGQKSERQSSYMGGTPLQPQISIE